MTDAFHAAMLRVWDSLTEGDISKMSRAECIGWLEWNDHNGSFSDDASEAEGIEPLTLESARQLLSDVRFHRI